MSGTDENASDPPLSDAGCGALKLIVRAALDAAIEAGAAGRSGTIIGKQIRQAIEATTINAVSSLSDDEAQKVRELARGAPAGVTVAAKRLDHERAVRGASEIHSNGRARAADRVCATLTKVTPSLPPTRETIKRLTAASAEQRTALHPLTREDIKISTATSVGQDGEAFKLSPPPKPDDSKLENG